MGRHECFKIIIPLEEKKNELKGIGDTRDARHMTPVPDASVLIVTSAGHSSGNNESVFITEGPPKDQNESERDTAWRVVSKRGKN